MEKAPINLPTNIQGFTLIEILIVLAIIVITSTTLLINFSSVRPNLDQASSVILSDTRLSQTKTTGSSKYNNQFTCGYGIRYLNSTSYALYVNLDPCSPKEYSAAAGDQEISVTTVNTGLELKTADWDIFFEPPDPTTYFSGAVPAPNDSPTAITVGKVGVACSNADCRTICVYPNGRIEPTLGASCP